MDKEDEEEGGGRRGEEEEEEVVRNECGCIEMDIRMRDEQEGRQKARNETRKRKKEGEEEEGAKDDKLNCLPHNSVIKQSSLPNSL